MQNLMHALVGPAKLLLSSQVNEKLAVDKINDTKTVDFGMQLCHFNKILAYSCYMSNLCKNPML